jgi:type II secretory pathway component PulF
VAISIPKNVPESKSSPSNWPHHVFLYLKDLNLRFAARKKVARQDVMFFTTQLSLMIETGGPINLSILSISNQVKNPYFKDILTRLVSHLEEGRLLSDAMAKYPEAFSQVYVSLIRAGETGGQLNEIEMSAKGLYTFGTCDGSPS